MKNGTKGILFALITAVISGFAIPVNKIFVVGIDPTVFTAVRALIIGTIFFLLASYKSKFKFSEFRKVQWKYILGIGIIGGGLAFLFYFTGLSLTTGGRAAFIHKTLPIYVTILAYIFLKERVSRKQSLGMLVMLGGLFALMSATINPATFWTDPATGDILVLFGTILWGIENTLAKKAMNKGEGNFIVSFGRMFIGGVLLMAIVVLLGKIDILLTLSQQQIINLFISTGILFGYVFFWYYSIKFINLTKASFILLISPVISTFLGVFWFNEPLPMLQILGSALILAGLLFILKSESELSTAV